MSAAVLFPDADAIARAAAALRQGKLVVFPTETVYGLGAHALDPQAVRAIFAAKRRPPDNPLIIHVADVDAARALVRAWPDAAERLARAFWPGPLTLVLERDARVPDVTTGGLDSVAVRVPDHDVARALLRDAAIPVAAPSANRSGRPSPTRAEDALADVGDAVDIILDGGPTRVGVESTVVSLLEEAPVVLRPGGVPLEALRSVAPDTRAATPADDAARSPGTRYRHYAPRADVRITSGDAASLAGQALALASEGHRVAIVASTENAPLGRSVRALGSRDDPAAWAHGIFATLRDLDEAGFDIILVEEIPEAGLGRAVMDRLRRAAER